MIAHVSIPARDPARAAQLLAALLDGDVAPFPVVRGALVVVARDGSGTAIEVLPEDVTIRRGRDDPLPVELPDGSGLPQGATFRHGALPAERHAVHVALTTQLSEPEVIALGRAAGVPIVACERGGLFGVVEIWIDERFLVEVLTPAQARRYRAIMSPAAQVSSMNASPSLTTRPAVAPAKCVPMTSVGVPASRPNTSRRVRVDCSAS